MVNTGVAPVRSTALATTEQVNAGRITSCPTPTPKARNVANRAMRPPAVASPRPSPTTEAKRRWYSATVSAACVGDSSTRRTSVTCASVRYPCPVTNP